jgi:hypothetical protein
MVIAKANADLLGQHGTYDLVPTKYLQHYFLHVRTIQN